MCITILPVCMFVYHLCAWCSESSKEYVGGSPENGVTKTARLSYFHPQKKEEAVERERRLWKEVLIKHFYEP